MKKSFKAILGLPVLAMTMSFLSGCGGFKKNGFAYDLDFNVDVRGQKIKMWAGFGSAIQDVLGDLLNEFERLTGVEVEYENKSDYKGCLQAVTLAATSGKYPNVVVGYPDHFASYVKSDIIVRLDYYFENDVHNPTFEPAGQRFTKDDFYADYMVENQSIEFDQNGKGYTLGVPFNKSTEVLVYNKSFFNYCAARDDLKDKIYVPRTYDELETVGQNILDFLSDNNLYNSVLKDANGKTVLNLNGIYDPTYSDATARFKPFSYDSQANLFITNVRQNGGSYTEFDKTSKKGYLAFNSNETVTGLTQLKRLYDKKILGIPADWGEAKYGSNPFKAFKTVMTLGSSAGVANDTTAGNKFEIGAAPVPYVDAQRKYVISQGANLALLDKGSREERVASWQLVKFLSKYANGYFCSQTGYYPTCPYAEKEGGMWANVDPKGIFHEEDYTSWLTQAKESLSTTDLIRAETAEVNLNSYIKDGEGWIKFIDPPFSGSADIRDKVASIPPFVFTGNKTIQKALDDIYAELSEYVRKQNMNIKKILLVPLFAMILVACNGGGGSSSNCEACQTRTGEQKDELLPTPITDSLKFAQANELEGKKFAGHDENAVDHLGYVSLKTCTDGDTANFTQDDYVDDFGAPVSIKTRFLGVNTPESTAKVEPWGKKASLFTKHQLEAAQADAEAKSTDAKKVYNIALINHPSATSFETKDSSGGRWLAFIWYRPTTDSDWRLLNLELVEQGFSRNQLFVDDPVCNYRTYFEAAENKNVECGYRVYGEIDKGYDYEEKTYEFSLWKIINDFENIGISDSGTSGVVLCVTALVVGIQGDNMFLRDVLLDKEQVEKGDNQLAGLYCYAGYNSSVCSILQKASLRDGMDGTGVGVVARFFCRATTYNNNVQLSDLKYTTTGKKGFRVLNESTFATYAEELKWSDLYQNKGSVTFADLQRNPASKRLEPSELTTYDDPKTENVLYDDLAPYHYQFVDTEVTIRSVGDSDRDEETGSSLSGSFWYKGNANDNSYTVYATINGKDGAKILTNLRIDTTLEPFIEPATFGTSDASDLNSAKSPVGTKWHVTGYLALYFGKFQILLPNNYAELNYLYKVS